MILNNYSVSRSIQLTLPLTAETPEITVTFTAQAMRCYPDHMQNMTPEFLMSDSDDAFRKRSFLINIRAECKYWCRDNCEARYRIEDMFETEGMRVYFESESDCVKFEKAQQCVLPCPARPEV